MSAFIRIARFGLRLLLPILVAGGALGAEPVRLAQADLYRDAMQSINEGRPNDARDTLIRLIEQEPQHAGAWLDIAIIQCELGQAAEAERLFRVIETRFAPPPGIREVIASHRASGCKGWQPRNHLSVTLGRGHDNNVNQGAADPNFSIGSGSSRVDLHLLPEYLPQSDQYTFLGAEYTRDLSPDGSLGFLQFRARKNASLNRYDTATLSGGIEHPWRFGNWQMRGTGSLAYLTLGGQLYQRQAQLQMRVAPPFSLPDPLHLNLVTGLAHVEYATLAHYDSNTVEFSGILTYQGERARLQASAGSLTDRGDAARPGGNRDGWFAGVQGSVALTRGMRAELGWTLQHWLGDKVYSPGIIDQIRRQDTHLLRAALIVPIKSQQTFNIEWRQVRNNENISIFQYNSQLLQFSWQWQGF